LRVENLGADDVRGQHVGGELEPGKLDVDAVGQRFDRQGLGQAGNAFQKHVAVGQQTDHQAFHQVSLAYNHLADLIKKRAHKGAGPLDLIVYRSNSSMHNASSTIPIIDNKTR